MVNCFMQWRSYELCFWRTLMITPLIQRDHLIMSRFSYICVYGLLKFEWIALIASLKNFFANSNNEKPHISIRFAINHNTHNLFSDCLELNSKFLLLNSNTYFKTANLNQYYIFYKKLLQQLSLLRSSKFTFFKIV